MEIFPDTILASALPVISFQTKGFADNVSETRNDGNFLPNITNCTYPKKLPTNMLNQIITRLDLYFSVDNNTSLREILYWVEQYPHQPPGQCIIFHQTAYNAIFHARVKMAICHLNKYFICNLPAAGQGWLVRYC